MANFLGEIHIVKHANDDWRYTPSTDLGQDGVLRVRPPRSKEKQFGYLSNNVPEPSEFEGVNDRDDDDEGDGD